MKTYSPIQLTIDKEQFDDMEKTIKELSESKNVLLLNAYRGLVTGLLSEVSQVPGFDIKRHLQAITDKLSTKEDKIRDIKIEGETEDPFQWYYMKIEMEGKKDKMIPMSPENIRDNIG